MKTKYIFLAYHFIEKDEINVIMKFHLLNFILLDSKIFDVQSVNFYHTVSWLHFLIQIWLHTQSLFKEKNMCLPKLAANFLTPWGDQNKTKARTLFYDSLPKDKSTVMSNSFILVTARQCQAEQGFHRMKVS